MFYYRMLNGTYILHPDSIFYILTWMAYCMKDIAAGNLTVMQCNIIQVKHHGPP